MVETLPPGAVADIAEQLDTDDAVQLIEDLDERDQVAILAELDPEDRAAIESALAYPEDLSPLWIAMLWAPHRLGLRDAPAQGPLTFVKNWAIAAFAGFMIIGTYYDHYVGPLLVPFFVLAARSYGRAGLRRKLAIGTIVFGIVCTMLHTVIRVQIDGSRAEFRAVEDAVERLIEPGDCIYVYEGDVALYHATRACTVTPYVFPTHLNSFKEEHALGIDTQSEMEAIVAARPAVIVKMAQPYNDPPNLSTRAVLQAALESDYTRVQSLPRGTREVEIWALSAD
jgi:hypothetical protein